MSCPKVKTPSEFTPGGCPLHKNYLSPKEKKALCGQNSSFYGKKEPKGK